ncbi:MAG: stage II sporulation protein D [Clostridia bacterium]|nr:stage II sporulation protein D [Clostridia bacterium]
MPASFDIEALKAQAVAARTYAMKKASAGKVLVASVSDQAYKTVDQMRQTWGGSFNYYYGRVQEAVYSTKGVVMMYNGNYIDALYHAISNGTTEMPKYIWNSSYPYLVPVDSSLDRNVKNYQASIEMDYGAVSSKLGVNVSEASNIEVLSYTESGRVNEINIGEAVFTGVQVRTKLGLRSTDFTIEKIGGGLRITTRGYGHGVGMSQYGANELAKIGYSFSDILAHYYTGIYFASV